MHAYGEAAGAPVRRVGDSDGLGLGQSRGFLDGQPPDLFRLVGGLLLTIADGLCKLVRDTRKPEGQSN